MTFIVFDVKFSLLTLEFNRFTLVLELFRKEIYDSSHCKLTTQSFWRLFTDGIYFVSQQTADPRACADTADG